MRWPRPTLVFMRFGQRPEFQPRPGSPKGNGPQFYHAKKLTSSDQRDFGGYPYYSDSHRGEGNRLYFEEKGSILKPALDSAIFQTYNTCSPKHL
jgi:hypothetical protein